MRLVLATRNAHKAREFGELLAPHEIVALPDDVELPPEDGDTFAANALGKARAAAAATGGHAIADDSGIEAAALGGAPGIYSARFAGEGATDEENLAKLLREAPAGSPVAYVCALAWVTPDGDEAVFEGRCTGTLAAEPRGDGGFGYDPAFLPDDLPGPPERTMAELTVAEKDAISHRGRAARALLRRLSDGAGDGGEDGDAAAHAGAAATHGAAAAAHAGAAATHGAAAAAHAGAAAMRDGAPAPARTRRPAE